MAKYASEMQRFAYEATLHIHHPTVTPSEITSRLPWLPQRENRVGEPRRRPDGIISERVYPENYWRATIPTMDGQDLVEFLSNMVDLLAPQRQFLSDLSATGGEVCCLIGVFTSACCAHQFPRQLLGDLAAMGMDLRLDIYGHELPQQVAEGKR